MCIGITPTLKVDLVRELLLCLRVRSWVDFSEHQLDCRILVTATSLSINEARIDLIN